jgi:ADP-ribose pyrophosphatase
MDVKHLEKLTDEKWVNLFAATFEHAGHTGRWVFASRRDRPHSPNPGDAVVIVAVLREAGEPPRLVLIREFRVPVGGYVIGLPAGLLEPGESVEDTVRREMREETGLEVVAVRRVTQPLVMSAGMSDESAALAFVDVRGSGPGGRPQPEHSEDIEVILADLDTVHRLCDDQAQAMDVKAWMVLYHYSLLGRLD